MYQKIVSEEQLAFPTGYGDVYIQPPHISPHTQLPVIDYAAKIKQNGADSAIFHCEIPFTVFNDIVKTNSGTMSIVDSAGKTIISSSGQMTSKDSVTNLSILNIINKSENGFGTYVKKGETNYVAFKQLPTFGWLIVYEKPYSSLLSGNTSLSQLEVNIFIAAISVGIAGFVIVLLLSSKISSPITQLANACRSQDVSNLKKIEVLASKDEVWDVANAVNEMISKINTLEKQKEEFTSMIAHELKTPLVPILGWCGSLKNSKIMGGVTLTERQFLGVDAIERNATRLKQLIGDIMDVHKLDLQKMKFEYTDINVTEFMSFMHSNLQGMMKPKEIQFTNSTINDSMVIKSDKNRLEQVMTNLILNAIDFVRADGKIEIDARDNGDGSILFSVKDNGIGIQKEKQQYLFKKFYQADTSRTRIHGGNG
ncbi:MAG TPA: ATP-binding protein, partial [Nitrosopumilaceae archaeon]|nr:ATP-binding protein [Nitrosopumilaceae archaeon]